jgi:hypothetical protein
MDTPAPEDAPIVPFDAERADAAEAGAPGDGGTVPPGCNPDGGIECDGDWEGRCTPACAASECCAPRAGVFACVARDALGRCPAADLIVDREQARTSARFEYRTFDTAHCAVQDRCIEAPGQRRLLRFDTRTPNIGSADMYLGMPSRTNPNFEYSACHGHYHFNTYAAYELRRLDGTVAARGHKQAFCLLDSNRYLTSAGATARYNCGNQGIQMGWSDVYGSGLDCQWVDVTDVAPGNYVLHIEINAAHILNETDYTNNVVDVPITVPPGDPYADPTAACTTAMQGFDRDCGWTVESTPRTCTPGTMVTAACSTACGLGSCTGDPMIRIYEGDRIAPGALRGLSPLTQNDDSGCPPPDGGRELCSQTRFTCPASGRYTVATAPYRSAEMATCTIATR